MSMEQETLIYVEENDKTEARILAQSFARKDIKSRAYINALGAELGMKYLALESINNSKVFNMHSVHKILEEFDISDIMLSNMHIDVRVVFDENFIFIPKSHFEYDILPDVYFVLLLSKDHSHASFLGYFEPKLINKNNQNSQYYFIEKEKLTPPANLKAFVENFKGNTTQSLSKNDNEKAELLMVSMADQNISSDETKELLKYLKKSADLRDEFIEFENFELLAYKAEHSTDVKIPESAISDAVPDTTIDDLAVSSEMAEGTAALEAEITNEPANELITDDLSLDGLVEDENPLLDQVLPENSVEENEIQKSEVPDVVKLAEDVAGGLAAAGMASLGAAAASDAIQADAVTQGLGAAEELLGDVMESLSEDSVSVNDLENISAETNSVNTANVDNMSQNLDIDGLSELGDIDMSSVALDGLDIDEQLQNIDSPNEGVANLESIHAGAGNFDDASLDDLMAPEADESSDLISIGSLQEETARQKGLLPSIEDESLLDNSLDFSKIEAVPQVDTKALQSHLDTVDISGFDAIAPEVRLEEAPENNGELDVLDISDVNAVPNNFGDNISETVELNNFVAVDNTCENQKVKQQTAPTADFNNMGDFEPLNTDDMFINESFDTDNISLSLDNEVKPVSKRPASPQEVDLTGFESIDMEPFEMKPLVGPQMDNSIPKPVEQDDLASMLLGDMDLGALDSIPNFEGPGASPLLDEDDDFDEKPENNGHVEGSLAVAPPGEAEMLNLDDMQQMSVSKTSSPTPSPSPSPSPSAVAAESVEELSIDDIVDSPEESNVDLSLISKAVDMDVAQDALIEDGMSPSEAIPSIDDVSVNSGEALPDLETSSVENADAFPEKAQIPSVDSSPQESSLDELEALAAGSSFSDTDNNDLSMLFEEASESQNISENISSSPLQQDEQEFVPTLPHLPERPASSGKGKIIGAAVLIAFLAAGTFFGLNMKNKNEIQDVEALSQPVPENNENPLPAPPAGQENNEDIMANAPEVIDMPQNQTEPTNVQPEPAKNVKDAKASATKPVNPEGAIISVKKLSWELPDYLSYSEEMKKYLQTAGKSIKLTLTSDLLLASEYAYSNQVKVSLKLSNEGVVQDAKVVQSSGSTEIDNIVLQTVKETLNVVKPAPGEVPTADFNLGLIINF